MTATTRPTIERRSMSRGHDSRTMSATPAPPSEATSTHGGAHLFLVLHSHRLLEPAIRISLTGLDEVCIGRGPARSIERRDDASVRRLALSLPDPWLSNAHARIARVLDRWMLEDAGSKNGSSVNGVPARRAELADGDLIELGHNFFIFHSRLAVEDGDPLPGVIDATASQAAAPGLMTLLPSLKRSFTQLECVARSAASVLIEGETGTGKEVVARALHTLSGRPGDFVAVNCGALPRELVEAELFGHRKGAFSGATEDRPGLVRSADRGTLLLDEIGDLPAPSQAAMLRVLQEREVRPLGSTRAFSVDFRVIAATNRPLEGMVYAGTFRADLLARLKGYCVELPPLRARKEDLGVVLGALLHRLSPSQAQQIQLHPRAARALLRHDWPGNIRELEKCLETALVLAGERARVELEHLPKSVRRSLDAARANGAADDAAARAEEPDGRREPTGEPAPPGQLTAKAIQACLDAHNGVIEDAWRPLGLSSRHALARLIRKYGLELRRRPK
ncbi:sigma 54-interacting transcriptional regulator [Sorangium sp. So ce185]|uniref:sigma 54-interacting transcriptional regulator n=1 Tax=Sorangium sp. So ce185 TaxID=3133287 RepID=UPI003F5D943D